MTCTLAVVFPERSAVGSFSGSAGGIQIGCRCKNEAARQREMLSCVTPKDIGLFDASSPPVSILVPDQGRKLVFMSVKLSC